ncbi:hypothetical protein [Vibrio breoganii]|uniref:hypothetical protein n=1 Tax=Vibrio breoganii TaxID=553239 RepID=UPI000C84221D|nr:hypothetical protein [Vibrio breoganii]PML61917.1 hypothetical protein BCT73_05910 [Vibrio breoganii]PMO81136.1 hypothetical protein BCT00_12385 [Vibrio breoganii]
MSNNGKINKLLYSSSSRVNSLILEAISHWQHGYCELVTSLPKIDDEAWDKWFVQIPEKGNDKSIKTIIDAYLHLGCAFSYADISKAEIERWIDAGDNFQSLTLKAKFKELSYELYHAIDKLESELFQNGQEIKAMILTTIGKHISIADYSLFATIVNSKDNFSLTNGCHLDGSQEMYLKLHVATGPKTRYADIPPFLKHG